LSKHRFWIPRLVSVRSHVSVAIIVCLTQLAEFRPKLVRRLERLEKSLNIPLDDRHQSQAYLTEWMEIHILGERIEMTDPEPQNQTTLQWGDSPTIPPTMPAVCVMTCVISSYLCTDIRCSSVSSQRRGSGRTAWKGAAGSPITVENFALEHYAKEGYKGYVLPWPKLLKLTKILESTARERLSDFFLPCCFTTYSSRPRPERSKRNIKPHH
jgi:hypothetical protein